MTPDAVSGLVGALQKGWGSHGYRFESIVGVNSGGALGLVAHFDGSRFQIEVDRWGNEVRDQGVQEALVPKPDPYGTIPMDDEPERTVPCAEFREDGTCIHGDCMMAAGLA